MKKPIKKETTETIIFISAMILIAVGIVSVFMLVFKALNLS